MYLLVPISSLAKKFPQVQKKSKNSKPIRSLLSSEHKLRFFWWNSSAFRLCIDCNAITTFKAQKGSKDVVKIVHVTSVVQATSQIFNSKENKNNDFILQFLLLPVSLWYVFMRVPWHVCGAAEAGAQCSDVEPGCAAPCLQAEEDALCT